MLLLPKTNSMKPVYCVCYCLAGKYALQSGKGSITTAARLLFLLLVWWCVARDDTQGRRTYPTNDLPQAAFYVVAAISYGHG